MENINEGRIHIKANRPEKGENKYAYQILLEEAAKDGVTEEGVLALLRYYTDTLEWGMSKAVDYTLRLFEEGTIKEIMKLKGREE